MLEHGRWMRVHLPFRKAKRVHHGEARKTRRGIGQSGYVVILQPSIRQARGRDPGKYDKYDQTNSKKKVPRKRKAKVVKPKEPEVDSADNNHGSPVDSDDDSDTDNDGDPDGQEDPPAKRPKKDGAAEPQTSPNIKAILKDARLDMAGKRKS